MSEAIRERTSAVAAWTRLVRVHQKLEKASERNFEALGLSSAWFDVLARVGVREGLTQGELADSLLVTKGNISQLVAKMEAGGLLERRAEGRCQHLWLTERGRALRTQAVPQQERLLGDSLSGLSGEEQSQLLRLLRKWEKP